jgi:NAD(P)-dependent dehydrogenase (short-subunit alcohol dehydrogenase family)
VSVGGRPDGNGHPRRRHAHAPGKADMSRPAAKTPRELAQDGIAVSAMLPSVIATDMLPALARACPAWRTGECILLHGTVSDTRRS